MSSKSCRSSTTAIWEIEYKQTFCIFEKKYFSKRTSKNNSINQVWLAYLTNDKSILNSTELLSPEFVLNKFYPKFNYINLNDANKVAFQSKKDVHIKITRPNPYGERYKLFVIKKGTFDSEFNLEKYGLNLVKKNDQIVVDTLNWKGEAKTSGFEMDDIITELKKENFDRPNKDVVYIFSLILLIIFGYFNHKEYRFKKN